MFEKILDCPQCGKRFHYEHEGRDFPPEIRCPECGKGSPFADFTALVFCTGCRTKIAIPLEMLYDPMVCCPQCNASLTPDDFSEYETCGNTINGVPGKKAPRKSILQPGDFFDKYKIIKLLGRGGMAEVYLAEHLLLKQKCALKLMQQGLDQDDPVFIKRFVREAKLTHSFNQPNIVKVFDAGSDFKTGCLYLAMEYVEGKTLSELSCAKVLSEDELLDVLESMAMALKTLDEARVVHRDIKPSNIMLTVDGVYKLMDLGIAKAESNSQAGEMTLTMDQTCIGTPGYASPEQCRAAHKVDIRSDIYSLGVTIYHAASRVMPFDGDTPVAIIIKVLQTEAEPLEKFRGDLSPQFIALIRKMMMKRADERPGSIDELLQLIRDVSSGKNFSTPREKAISAGKEILTVTGQFLRMTGHFLRMTGHFLRMAGHFLRMAAVFFRTNIRYSPPAEKEIKLVREPKFFPFLKGLFTFFLRLFIGLLLAAVAGIHLVYVWKYYRADSTDRSITYTGFMKQLLGIAAEKHFIANSTGRNAQKDTQQKLNALHPLARYPDALGDANITYHWKKRQTYPSYPLVSYNTRLNVKTGYDFNSLPRSTSITDTMLKDGVFSLSDAAVQEMTQKNSFRRFATIYYIPGFTTGISGSGMTISVNLRLNKEHSGALMRIGTFELLCWNNYLYVVISNNYVFKSPFKVVEEKWFNLTLSMDNRTRKLTVLSGDRLLGSVLTISHRTMGIGSLIFHSGILNRHFNGGIDSMAFCDAPLEITLRKGEYGELLFSDRRFPDFSPVPEGYRCSSKDAALAAPATPVAPATPAAPAVPAAPAITTAPVVSALPAQKTSQASTALPAGKSEALLPVLKKWSPVNSGPLPQSLDEQLERSRQNFQRYSEAVDAWQDSLKDLPASLPAEIKRKRRSIVNVALELRKRWEKRIEYLESRNEKIKAARNASYSREANENIKQQIRMYSSGRSSALSGNSSSKTQKKKKWLIGSLLNKNADPNLQITTPGSAYRSGPLLAWALRGTLPHSDELLKILIKRHADPMALSSGYYSTRNSALIEYGLPPRMLNSTFYLLTGSTLPDDGINLLAILFTDGAAPNNFQLSRAVIRKEYDLVLLLLAFGLDPNGLDQEHETAFFNACRIKNGEKFRNLLLAAGADPAIVNRRGEKAKSYMGAGNIAEVFQSNDLAAIRAALKSGVSPDIFLPDGSTPLITACRQGNVAMVKLLLEYNASATRSDAKGNTPIQVIFRGRSPREPLSEAAKAVNTEIVELLLEKGAPPNVPPFLLTRYTDCSRILPALLKHGRKIPASSPYWRSIVYMWPVGHIDEKTAKLLIAHTPAELLQTVVFTMLTRRQHITPEMLESAFKRGLNPNAFRSYRRITNGRSEQHRVSLLQLLITSRQSPRVVETALKAGADPSVKLPGGKPLTSLTGNPRIRQLLKKYMSEQ